MAILNREQFLDKIKARIGEGTTDDDIEFVRDMTETFDSFADQTNWKQKFEDNDREWRQKYRDTFFNGKPMEEPQEETDGNDAPKTFDDLFTIKKGK